MSNKLSDGNCRAPASAPTQDTDTRMTSQWNKNQQNCFNFGLQLYFT